MGRSADTRGSPLGAPRTDRRLATLPGGEADQGTSSRPLAGLRGEGHGQTRQERQSSRTRTPPPRQAGKRRTTAMNLIAELEAEQIKALGQGHPRLRRRRHGAGRLQGHRGLALARAGLRGRVIARNGGSGIGASFTVRKISFGEGVERVFPLHSPNIDSITVVRRGKVRRAKLYYLRERRGKSARIVEKTNYREKTERLRSTTMKDGHPPRLPLHRGQAHRRHDLPHPLDLRRRGRHPGARDRPLGAPGLDRRLAQADGHRRPRSRSSRRSTRASASERAARPHARASLKSSICNTIRAR